MVCYRVLASQGNDNPDPGLFSDNGGYYVFPNGLIIQWGQIDNLIFDEVDTTYINFPKTFPHKCLNVQASLMIYTRYNNTSRIPGLNQVYVENYTNSRVGFYRGYAQYENNKGKIYWFAIGY